MNFLQDLVNELSNESKDNSKELDGLYDYVVESSYVEIKNTLSFIQSLEDTHGRHFSNGDVSFENYQSYVRNVELLLLTTGVELPATLIVPSFESTDVVKDTDDKKRNIFKRAWDGFINMLKRLKDWIVSKFSKDKTKVDKVNSNLKQIQSNASSVNSAALKTSSNTLDKLHKVQHEDKDALQVVIDELDAEWKEHDAKLKAKEDELKASIDALEKSKLEKEAKLIKDKAKAAKDRIAKVKAEQKAPIIQRVNVYEFILKGNVVDLSDVTNRVSTVLDRIDKLKLALDGKDDDLMQSTKADLEKNFFNWAKDNNTFVEVTNLDWKKSLANMDAYTKDPAWPKIVKRLENRSNILDKKIKAMEGGGVMWIVDDTERNKYFASQKLKMELFKLANSQVDQLLDYYYTITNHLKSLSSRKLN